MLEPLTFLETTAVETLDDLAAVLDGVGSNALVAMLDTGHINVTARSLGRDPIEYLQAHIDRLGPRLQHLHLDDNHGDLDAHLLPGEGNFDFAAAYAALQRAGYAGWLSAELMMFGANPRAADAAGTAAPDPRAHAAGLGRQLRPVSSDGSTPPAPVRRPRQGGTTMQKAALLGSICLLALPTVGMGRGHGEPPPRRQHRGEERRRRHRRLPQGHLGHA